MQLLRTLASNTVLSWFLTKNMDPLTKSLSNGMDLLGSWENRYRWLFCFSVESIFLLFLLIYLFRFYFSQSCTFPLSMCLMWVCYLSIFACCPTIRTTLCFISRYSDKSVVLERILGQQWLPLFQLSMTWLNMLLSLIHICP